MSEPRPVPDVPEVSLALAPDSAGLWDAGYRSDEPPPYWRFAWAGGRVLARYLLDHPDQVRGRRVLDVGSGSGLVAVAAALTGAASVRAVDLSAAAVAATRANAAANGVRLRAEALDATQLPPDALFPADTASGAADVSLPAEAASGVAASLPAEATSGVADASVPAGAGDGGDLVVAGDVCYAREVGERMGLWLRDVARSGARVLVGDADRGFLRAGRVVERYRAELRVPVALERSGTVPAVVWEVTAGPASARS